LLRPKIAEIASGFFTRFGSPASHGAGVRIVMGWAASALRLSGLAAVFEHGWPRYREALEAGWTPEHAAFYLMAILMQQVEDTTAVHRCGLEGLGRLRQDGARLQKTSKASRRRRPCWPRSISITASPA